MEAAGGGGDEGHWGSYWDPGLWAGDESAAGDIHDGRGNGVSEGVGGKHHDCVTRETRCGETESTHALHQASEHQKGH